jgi:serine/threonine protein kinase
MLRGVYRLERRLGSGGMGVVYLASDLELDRPVAVKTLPRVTSEGAASLRAEARAMAAVTHPNLAVVYGVETWRGIPFVVEEYLPGGTLGDRLADGPITIAAVLDLGITLTDVLGRLHDCGIIHRDVKPGNIGFTQAGILKLLDFGLAQLVRAAESASEDTTTGGDTRHGRDRARAVVGTPAYMAPEALLGLPPQPAFDLWSLSVVLYEAITGIRPFRGRQDGEVVMPTPASPPGTLRAGIPHEVDVFFAQAFSREPAGRHADARAMQKELRALRALVG